MGFWFILFLVVIALGLLRRGLWARIAAVALGLWILLFPARTYFGLSLPGSLAPANSTGPKPTARANEAVIAGGKAAVPKIIGGGVKACRISLDETRLLLVSDDGRGHAVDLRTGKFVTYSSKIDTREWPESFSREDGAPIGPDADMYFDSDRNVIARFSDAKFRYGIGGGSNQFVSFTSSPGQIVVYNRDTRMLRRIEIPIGTVIWSLKLPDDAKTLAARVFTSPDYAWTVLAIGKNHGAVIGMRDGRMTILRESPKQIKNVQFGPKWIRISGEKNAVYLLPGLQPKDDVEFGDEEIATYDLERNTYVTKDGRVTLPNGGISISGPVLHAAVLNPDRYAVAMEEGKNQMKLVDLDTQQGAGIGKVHGGGFDRAQACFTVSSTRRVFAAALGNEVEIFWSAYLAAGQFRSVVLTLPVD